MKVLVTGSGGQLGSDLVPALKAGGFSVAGFDSKALDITDEAVVAGAVAEVNPGVIVNCAAYTLVDKAESERERAFSVNRDGARVIASAAKKKNALLIHVSTDFVFDGAKPAPYNETDAVNPLSVYGESKLAGEAEIQKSGARFMIARTSWLYGSSGGNFVKTVLRLAGERESLRVVYDQTGSPTWTKDLATALTAAIRAHSHGRGAEGVYHYSNEGVASWYDFALAVIEEATANGAEFKCKTLEPILTSGYPTPAKRPAYSVLNKEKIKKALGIAIPHWRVSLRAMVKELYGGKH